MGGFLEQFCILQSIDELELFALHPLDIHLVVGLLLGLSGQLLLDLLPGAVLPLQHVELALLGSLLLLPLDHVLHVLSPLVLVTLLLHVPLPNSFFISLRLHCSLFLSLQGSHFARMSCLLVHTLALQVLLPFDSFLHLLLIHAVLLLLVRIDVPLPLRDDLPGTFTRFIDLLHDLTLFHLEETDTVAEEF